MLHQTYSESDLPATVAAMCSMDQFGDVMYNNYNATGAGMIATATPAA